MSAAIQEAHPHSYERFATRPFYVALDRDLVARAPRVHTATDFASGTGAIIGHLLELGKLEEPFVITGVEPDPDGIAQTIEKFHFLGSSLQLIESGAETVPVIEDNSQDLVTFFNAVHLTDATETFAEAHRILKPGGKLLVNTAYTKDFAYPDNSGGLWGRLIVFAKMKLKETHPELLPQIESPVDLFKYTSEDYELIAREAGFGSVDVSLYRADMNREDVKAICDYSEFGKGALPGIDPEISTTTLVSIVDAVFDRAKVETTPRGWMFLEAEK